MIRDDTSPKKQHRLSASMNSSDDQAQTSSEILSINNGPRLFLPGSGRSVSAHITIGYRGMRTIYIF